MAKYVNDTAILLRSDDPVTASLNLQNNLIEFKNWLNINSIQFLRRQPLVFIVRCVSLRRI